MNESPELGYHALCIDTNIFRQAGYALDRGLLGQLDQFGQSPVQVVISEIVAKEMHHQLTERVASARGALERGLREVQQEMLVSEGGAQRARKAILTGDTNEQIAQRRLDQFYERCDAMVLPADTVNSHDVLARYFNREPPFAATADKKQEFPDAYALMSVEKWAEENNFKVLVVSRDKGWGEFCQNSERLVFRAELGAALQLFQPHNAVARLTIDLNACLIDASDDHGIVETLRESIKGSVETTEIGIEAHSQFYWETDEVHAVYKSHQFRTITPEQVDIDLVRATGQEVVVRLVAEITCDVHVTFSLSMTDPVDQDEVSMGSKVGSLEQTFDSDVLVSFEGDVAQGLTGVSIKSVEVANEIPTVEFGEIEQEWGQEDVDYNQGERRTEDE